MNKTNNTKRWSVIRRNTGTIVRSFDSRAAAREYKRNARGHLGLYDNVNAQAVR